MFNFHNDNEKGVTWSHKQKILAIVDSEVEHEEGKMQLGANNELYDKVDADNNKR